MGELVAILVPATVFITVAVIVISILNYSLKRNLIRSGYTDLQLIQQLGQSYTSSVDGLKWGCVLLFGGIGLLIINFIPEARTLEAPLPYAIELIAVALGFLCYYLILKYENKKGLSN